MDIPDPPALYKRKYSEKDNISFKDLRTAYHTAARMVERFGDKYLPIFERLDTEIESHQQQETLRARALKIAQRSKVNKTK